MNNLLCMSLIKQRYSENICMCNEKKIQRLKKEPQENMHLILGDFSALSGKSTLASCLKLERASHDVIPFVRV